MNNCFQLGSSVDTVPGTKIFGNTYCHFIRILNMTGTLLRNLVWMQERFVSSKCIWENLKKDILLRLWTELSLVGASLIQMKLPKCSYYFSTRMSTMISLNISRCLISHYWFIIFVNASFPCFVYLGALSSLGTF